VWADPDRLAQVIANLVENACSYAVATVDVCTAYDGNGASVTVDDDGRGIPAEDLPHVFDRLWANRPGMSRHLGLDWGWPSWPSW